MARKESAGIVLYRYCDSKLEVFLVHPGGPFWKNKDAGAWSIPKGEFEPGEDPLEAAKREFHEETGYSLDGSFIPLRPVRQPGGKVVHAWALEGDCVDPSQVTPLRWSGPRGRAGSRSFSRSTSRMVQS